MTAAVVLAGPSVLAGLVAGSGCTTETVTVPVRSLERSGRVSFVCLAAPGQAEGPALPMERCDGHTTEGPRTYADDGTGAPRPHLYGLVTQTVRGEIAVVDMTASSDSVLDQDAHIPGANFLPIGAQPVDIASTPGGVATFVSVAEVGREGIYALPSAAIRPDGAARTLTSWPACSLTSAPGAMVIVADPAQGGATRASCDAAYGEAAPAIDGEEAGAHGDLLGEGNGRYKLVVALPEEGAIAVIDAQRLLDRDAGSYGPCPYERWLPLVADVPPPQPRPADPASSVCVSPPSITPGSVSSFMPRPAGMTYGDGRLYVADLDAPVVHVIDLPTPCEPVERAPLRPSSVAEPDRVVTTTRVAVSPRATSDLRRFLYAIDAQDGSAMAFDVTDDTSPHTPLARKNPAWNPFDAIDRIAFGAPARDIIIVSRDAPAAHPATGVAPSGTRCDPDPDVVACTAGATTCDVETLYRTATSTYESGAGPRKLRGVFAFMLLTSGAIAVIDIEDYDADCRGPRLEHTLYGCDSRWKIGGAWPTVLSTSDEASCHISTPNTPRSAHYQLSLDQGRHEPGLQRYPLLSNVEGTLVSATSSETMRMRATLPVGAVPKGLVPDPDDATKTIIDDVFFVSVGGARDLIDTDTGVITKDDETFHALAMNLEDPRAQLVDQQWDAIYEGALPGFGGRVGDLRLGGTGEKGLYDANSRFCDAGVQSQQAVRAKLALEPKPAVDPTAPPEFRTAAELDEDSADLADLLQVTRDFPVESDGHWKLDEVAAVCTYQQCKTALGVAASPTPNREIMISEAYQDHLVLDDRGRMVLEETESPVRLGTFLECCFPTLVTFDIRAGQQWIVLGQANGFLHHVIPDPATGVCRDSCDPAVARLNGRVRTSPHGAVTRDGDPFAFINPMFRFAITQGSCALGADACSDICASPTCLTTRGDRFTWVTQGAFVPLLVDLRADTDEVQPQAITLVPATGDLAVTDGALEGLMIVSPSSIDLKQQFF